MILSDSLTINPTRLTYSVATKLLIHQCCNLNNQIMDIPPDHHKTNYYLIVSILTSHISYKAKVAILSFS